MNTALAIQDHRSVDRDAVHFRARIYGADAQVASLLVVNMSPHGLMARTDRDHREGDRVRLVLPQVGVVAGDIRWSLGGRIGVRFDMALDLAAYYGLLAVVLKA